MTEVRDFLNRKIAELENALSLNQAHIDSLYKERNRLEVEITDARKAFNALPAETE